MHIQVEFAGLARVSTGLKQVSLAVSEQATFQDIIQILGAKYPNLLGEVIQPDGKTLYPSNMLNLNGKHMVQASQMQNSPQEGARIILMSVLAGG